MLQNLIALGVNLLDASDICIATVDNAVIEQAVRRLRPRIEQGKGFGETIGTLPVYPPIAAQMIRLGEATGNMDLMLRKVADFYEKGVEIMAAGLSQLIAPIMIVFLSGLVGMI